jgi:hypothetical protein
MADKKKYVILIFGTGEGMLALPEKEKEEYMGKWSTWTKELQDKGYYLTGEPFQPQGKVIRGKSMDVSDGFYSPNKDYVIGGYYLIQAADMDQAVSIAKGCPTFEYDGVLEVREIMEM